MVFKCRHFFLNITMFPGINIIKMVVVLFFKLLYFLLPSPMKPLVDNGYIKKVVVVVVEIKNSVEKNPESHCVMHFF